MAFNQEKTDLKSLWSFDAIFGAPKRFSNRIHLTSFPFSCRFFVHSEENEIRTEFVWKWQRLAILRRTVDTQLFDRLPRYQSNYYLIEQRENHLFWCGHVLNVNLLGSSLVPFQPTWNCTRDCCVLSLELFEKSFQPTTISPRTLNLFITFPTASQLDYASKGKSWALFRNFPTYSTVGRDFPERRLEFRYEKKAFRCHPLSYRVVALDMCTHKTYTYDL